MTQTPYKPKSLEEVVFVQKISEGTNATLIPPTVNNIDSLLLLWDNDKIIHKAYLTTLRYCIGCYVAAIDSNEAIISIRDAQKNEGVTIIIDRNEYGDTIGISGYYWSYSKNRIYNLPKIVVEEIYRDLIKEVVQKYRIEKIPYILQKALNVYENKDNINA